MRIFRVPPKISAQDLFLVEEAPDEDDKRVYSLGAIAFHLFANRAPQILRDQKGLSISSVLDGAGPKLEELIQWSTHPDVLT